MSDKKFPSIKLIYFNFGGRAEAIRLALHVGGVPFEDIRITEDEFRREKAANKYPFGSVPVLIVDDITYAQSVGILRYVGRLGGLYPDLPVAGLAIDQIIGGVEDIIVATVPFLFANDAEKPALKEKLQTEVYPRFFSAFERILKDHGDGYVYQGQLTIADLAVFPVLHWITTSIVSTDSLTAYPLLSGLMEKIRNHPKVKEYYKLEKEKSGQT